MRIALPRHRLSIDPSDEWVPDEIEPGAHDSFGLYLRSRDHGVFLSVRAQVPFDQPLTAEGLLAFLRAQSWASPPFDEWTATSGPLVIVGGTFETVGMGGEVVTEVFATDGRSVATLAGPGERTVIAALAPAVRQLASTIRFE